MIMNQYHSVMPTEDPCLSDSLSDSCLGVTGRWRRLMSKSIAVSGAGPGLGQAVAHRYAQDG